MIKTLPDAVELLIRTVDQELTDLNDKSIAVTSRICQCYTVDDDFFAPLFAVRTRLATVRSDQLDGYKTALVFYQQREINLKYVVNVVLLIYVGIN